MRINRNPEYNSVSPFFDRLIFEYTANLLQSSYLKRKTKEVIEFLVELTGREFISSIFLKNADRKKYEKIKEGEEDFELTSCKKMLRLFTKTAIVDIVLRDILPVIRSLAERDASRDPMNLRVENLSAAFKLSPVETKILLFFHLVEKMDALDPLSNIGNIDNFLSKMVFVNQGHKLIGVSKKELIQTLRTRKLFDCGLLEKDTMEFSVQNWVEGFFLEINSPDIASEFCSLYEGNALPLEEHVWDGSEKDMFLELLKRRKKGMNFLLYGEPGTGKTEFAKSLALATKKRLYIIKNRENEEVGELKTAIIASTNVLDPEDTVLLVDEADALLNSRDSYIFSGEQNSKSWLNSLLDSTRHKIIWITNNSSRMEPSVLRRFAFSRFFKRLSVKQKNRIFKTCLKQNNLENFLSDEEIGELNKRFRVNAGGISDLLKNLNIRKNSNKVRALKKIEIILEKHERAITGERAKSRKLSKTKNYSPSLLNTSEKPERVIRALANFADTKGGGTRILPRNINLLFYGAPGTGKSEFAKYLAESLERELVLKRASDLLSSWVGETEKQIARAFEEAEDEKAVLFIDEADSFFIERTGARYSWERSQTNELLTRMENFRGIFISATNFKEGLDHAALRRFKFKVEFRPLLSKGLLEIYDLLLAPLANGNLPHKEKQLLLTLDNLTPGDFHVVSDKIILSGERPAHSEVIDALFEESRHRSRDKRIGF